MEHEIAEMPSVVRINFMAIVLVISYAVMVRYRYSFRSNILPETRSTRISMVQAPGSQPTTAGT